MDKKTREDQAEYLKSFALDIVKALGLKPHELNKCRDQLRGTYNG